MNAEVIKAINQKEKKLHELSPFLKKVLHQIAIVVLFPLWLLDRLEERYKHWVYSKNQWNEARAKEILDYYIPRKAKWHKDNKEFYFYDNGYGWAFCYSKKYLKRKDRNFWKYNVGIWGGNIRDYLLDKFELEGFIKEVIDQNDGHTEIAFALKG